MAVQRSGAGADRLCTNITTGPLSGASPHRLSVDDVLLLDAHKIHPLRDRQRFAVEVVDHGRPLEGAALGQRVVILNFV